MLNRKNTELTGALAALREEFDNHEVANEYWCKDIEDRMENLDEIVDRYAGLPSDVEDTDYRVNDLESRVDDLEEQVNAQANVIRDLELALAELIALEVNDLASRIAKLEVK
jgi:uncharacterized coiled-coil protein SlyX